MVAAGKENLFTQDALERFVKELMIAELLGSEVDDLVDDEMVKMVCRWEWRQDPIQTIPGISVASAFFGKKIEGPDEKVEKARKLLQPYYTQEELLAVPAVQDDESFPTLYQIEPGLRPDQYMLLQQLIAKQLLGESHKGLGIQASQVDVFFLATTVPVEKDWAKKIARIMGIPEERVIIYHKACNSSGSAIFELHSGVYDEELALRVEGFADGATANISLFAIEDANRLIGQGDALSPQFFSSAASAISLRYSKLPSQGPLTLLHGAHKDVKKGSEYLQSTKPYDTWVGYRQENRVVESLYLQDPGEGWIIKMNGPRSGEFFRSHAVSLIKEVFTQYIEQEIASGSLVRMADESGDLNLSAYTPLIKRIVMHHPGAKVFKSVGEKLMDMKKVKLGFSPEQMPFVITEGNAPSATIPIALGRQLVDIKGGAKIILLSFGAGGSFTCGIYEYNLQDEAEAEA